MATDAGHSSTWAARKSTFVTLRSLGISLAVPVLAWAFILSWRSPLDGAEVRGQPGEALKVKRVTRLTPPQVAGNVTDRFYSVHGAFNSDSTRVAYFENPTKLVTGNLYTDFRGMVWGKIDELKSWTTLEEYLAVAHFHPVLQHLRCALRSRRPVVL